MRRGADRRTCGAVVATLALLAWAALAAAPAGAGQVVALSAADPGLLSDSAGGASSTAPYPGPAASADGRFVAYVSAATNLVPGQVDANGDTDVFLFDRATGANTLVSRSGAGPSQAGNGASAKPSVSADGRFVAFVSLATDLVAGQSDGNLAGDVFLFDRVAGTVTLVSHAFGTPSAAGSAASDNPVVSADGNFVAYASDATDLVAAVDANHTRDVFLYDRTAGASALVSYSAANAGATGDGYSDGPSVSADGRFVAFVSSAGDLVPGQIEVDPQPEVFLYDRTTAATVLVSHRDGAPATAGNRGAGGAAVSADGTAVAYDSLSTDLVAGYSSAAFGSQVYLYDVVAGTSLLVSHTSGSATTGCGQGADGPAVSADGAFLAYRSACTDLMAGQVQPTFGLNVFLYDRAAGTSTLASHVAGDPATAGSPYLSSWGISADGAWVVYESNGGGLVTGQSDTNGTGDVFLYGRGAGTSVLVSRTAGAATTAGDAGAFSPAISADGAVVAFTTGSDDVAPGNDANGATDVLVYDRAAGGNALASRAATPAATAGGTSSPTAVTPDGRFAVFSSEGRNVVPGQVDGNRGRDVFLYDRESGARTLVSHAAGAPATAGNGPSAGGVMSADGRWIAFVSRATDLVAGATDANADYDLFLWDRESGAAALVSYAAGSPATAADRASSAFASMSADGRYLLFGSEGRNLVAGQVESNNGNDVFLYDRVAAATTLVSHAAGSPATTANANSDGGMISADGNFVLFTSGANNLVAGVSDVNGTDDVFLYDRAAGTTALVSHAAGSPATAANNWSTPVALSADGRYALFNSRATNLVPGETNALALWNVYFYDRVTGVTTLVSHAPSSPAQSGSSLSFGTGLSADGRFVVFHSEAPDLLPGGTDFNGGNDVFLWDRLSGALTLVSHAAGSPTQTAAGLSEGALISADGRAVAFVSKAQNLVQGTLATASTANVFLYDRETDTVRLASRTPASPLAGGDGPSNVVAALSADGGTVAFASGAGDLAAGDLNGAVDAFLFQGGVRGAFYTVAPCRLLDTRLSGPALASGGIRTVLVHGHCGVPETARSVAVNVTITQPTAAGHLTVAAGDLATPGASTLNFGPNQTRANGAIPFLAGNGTGTLALAATIPAGGTVQAILDVAGYFE